MWYALSGNKKWPWVVIREVKFHTRISGVSFNSKYFELSIDGVLTLRKGYAWNGNTGLPLDLEKTIFKLMLDGSAIHDALYQAMKTGLLPKSYRRVCDMVLLEQWLKDGVPNAIANVGYLLVRLIGWTRI